MSGSRVPSTARTDIPVWGMTATVCVTYRDRLGAATDLLTEELALMDSTCSRFRADSEINTVLNGPGKHTLSPLLNDAIGAALWVASATGGLVDPTVAAAVIALGYDRDIALLDLTSGGAEPAARPTVIGRTAAARVGAEEAAAPIGSVATATAPRPAPGARRIQHDPTNRTLLVPAGVRLDLGASAKALAVDRAATGIAARLGCGALVGIGGDIAVAGAAPIDGWRIAIGDHHRTAERDRDDLVAIAEGGLATSSIAARNWRTATGVVHHIVDPRTGADPAPCWRTVSAVAGSTLAANAAATAAIVLGAAAPRWLRSRQIPARLVFADDSVVTVAGWPDDRGRVA